MSNLDKNIISALKEAKKKGIISLNRSPDAGKTIIETERLLLRTWQPTDTPLMAAISADPSVMEHFPATSTLTETEALIERINQHYKAFGYTLYAVETKSSHEFIGFVGLMRPTFTIPHFTPKHLPIVEIGWRLSSKHWGQGFATEAAKAVLHYAFTDLQIKEIVSFTASTNIKSQRVMEKIGLQHHPEDDFDHPNLDKTSSLSRHVLYRLSAQVHCSQR